MHHIPLSALFGFGLVFVHGAGASAQSGPTLVPSQHATIQAAITAAPSPAVILVSPGNYSEKIDLGGKDLYVVSVEGPAEITSSDTDADLRPMARRYFGEEQGDWYTDNAEHGPDPVRISMTPERWFSVDYRKMTLPADAPALD